MSYVTPFPAVTVDATLLTTDTSAWVTIVVVTEELLLPGVWSVVALLTVAVLLTVPAGVLAFTVAMTVMTCEAPAASGLMVSVMALPLWVRLNCGPPGGWLCDPNVSPVGRV